MDPDPADGQRGRRRRAGRALPRAAAQAATSWRQMFVMRSITRRRGFLVVLPVIGTVFLLLLLLLPMSTVYLGPEMFVALALSVASLAYVLLNRAGDARRAALVVCLGMTAAMTVAMLGDGPSRVPLALLAWFPWAGSYAGLVSRRLAPVLAVSALVCAALTAAMAVRGDIAIVPLTYVSALLSVLAGAMFAYSFFHWGRDQAFNDPLTGLTNRAGLLHAGEPAIAELQLAGHSAVLMVIDVNHFKEINTAFGHQAGDEALRELADHLRRLRPTPLFVGRLGGDEFALVIPGHPFGVESDEERVEYLRGVARRALDQIDGLLRVRGVDVDVECTAGLAIAPHDGDRLATLLPCADAALASAKQGGVRIGIWTAGMAGLAGVRSWELSLHAQLRSAIARRELVMFFQPLQEAATGRVAGVEALVRWRHPERGLLPPGSFLPMAERSSLIIDLTWWELDEVLGQCARWAREGLRVPVSANLSARMLVLDDLPELITRRLDAYHLPADMLTLEITESALVSQPARAAAMLGELRTAGVKLSLDDFGTGYSSMEILKALPFDEMKIDKGFVTEACGSLPDLAIVRSVVDLGHRLGMRVVGEGVEDEAAARMLTELGVDLLQGDALSPPLPAEDLATLLARGFGAHPRPTRRSEEDPQRRADVTAGVTEEKASPLRVGAATSPGRPAGSARPTGPEGPSAGTVDGGRVSSGNGHRAGAAAIAAAGVPFRPTTEAVTGVEVPGETTRLWERIGLHAPHAPDEVGRVAALRRYRILDTPAEPEFDAVAALAAQLCDCAYGYVTFVAADREWFKALHGLEIDPLRARTGPASYVVAEGRFLEIPDTTRDLRFAHVARATPGHVAFFAGAPLRTEDGHVLGTLCVSDRRPRRLTSAQRDALTEMAGHVMRLLHARMERQLLDEVTGGLERLDQFWHRHDLPAAATLFAEVVRVLTDADAVAVLLPDLPGGTVFHPAGFSIIDGMPPLTHIGVSPMGEGEHAMRELGRMRGPVFIPDAHRTPMVPKDLVRRLAIASVLLVPLRGDAGLEGLVAARWRHPLPRLDPAVLRAVTLFTGQGRFVLTRLHSAAGRATGTTGSDDGARPMAAAPGDERRVR